MDDHFTTISEYRPQHDTVQDASRGAQASFAHRSRTMAWGGLLMLLVFAAGACAKSSQLQVQDQAEANIRSTAVAGADVTQEQHNACNSDASDRQVVEYDTNGDRVPDVRKTYRRFSSPTGYDLVMLCREVDVNGDGRKDSIRYFNNLGVAIREETDRNLDGKIDQVQHVQGDRVIRVLEDTNYDGVIDQRTYYRGGKPHRVERDTAGRSKENAWKPNRWEYVEKGRTIRVGRDINGNGQVDRWDRNEEE